MLRSSWLKILSAAVARYSPRALAWTDPDKLQIQVDALDEHPDWVLCFHSVRCMPDGANEPTRIDPGIAPAAVTTSDDLLDRNYIPTCSLVFRHGVLREFPDWYLSLTWGDWPPTLMLARDGQLGFIERVMADYRLHSDGSHTGKSHEMRLKANIDMYRCLNRAFHSGNSREITRHTIRRYVDLGALFLNQGRVFRALGVAHELLATERTPKVLTALWSGNFRIVLRPAITQDRVRGGMPLPQYRLIERISRK